MERNDLPLPTAEIQRLLTAGVLSVRPPREEVDDLVQEAWLALLAARRRLAEVSGHALAAYIRRIAHSTAIDRLRQRSTQKRGGGSVTLPLDAVYGLSVLSPDPERHAIARDCLRRALRTATGGKRLAGRILALRFLSGRSSKEVARLLGLRPSSVDTAVHRARRRLAAHGETP